MEEVTNRCCCFLTVIKRRRQAKTVKIRGPGSAGPPRSRLTTRFGASRQQILIYSFAPAQTKRPSVHSAPSLSVPWRKRSRCGNLGYSRQAPSIGACPQTLWLGFVSILGRARLERLRPCRSLYLGFPPCLCSPTPPPRVGRGSVHQMKRNAVTRSISQSADSPAGDSLTEYQKGVGAARDFLRALSARAAGIKHAATSTTDSPEHPEQPS
jgi:hypothetical protein